MARWESKVLKAGDKLLVELPPDVLKLKKLKRGDTVVFLDDVRGGIQLENKASLDSKKCVICNEGTQRNTCISCGRKVCSNCYFNMAGLCHVCANVDRKKPGRR